MNPTTHSKSAYLHLFLEQLDFPLCHPSADVLTILQVRYFKTISVMILILIDS